MMKTMAINSKIIHPTESGIRSRTDEAHERPSRWSDWMLQ